MFSGRLLTPARRLPAQRAFVALGALGLLVGLEREGHLSQVSIRGIELKEVVEQSPLIVVAHRATPRERVEQVPIGPTADAAKTPPAPAAKAKTYPPFTRVWARFVVEEVLRGPKQLAGKTVEIKGAHDGEQLWIHRNYYVDGQSESPIFDGYHSSIDWKKGEPAQVILFLREHEGVQSFAAEGAFEQLSRRAEVTKLIAQPSLSAMPSQ